eukprot:858375-Pyramimonas_sp.AAC.1
MFHEFRTLPPPPVELPKALIGECRVRTSPPRLPQDGLGGAWEGGELLRRRLPLRRRRPLF